MIENIQISPGMTGSIQIRLEVVDKMLIVPKKIGQIGDMIRMIRIDQL